MQMCGGPPLFDEREHAGLLRQGTSNQGHRRRALGVGGGGQCSPADSGSGLRKVGWVDIVSKRWELKRGRGG